MGPLAGANTATPYEQNGVTYNVRSPTPRVVVVPSYRVRMVVGDLRDGVDPATVLPGTARGGTRCGRWGGSRRPGAISDRLRAGPALARPAIHTRVCRRERLPDRRPARHPGRRRPGDLSAAVAMLDLIEYTQRTRDRALLRSDPGNPRTGAGNSVASVIGLMIHDRMSRTAGAFARRVGGERVGERRLPLAGR